MERVKLSLSRLDGADGEHKAKVKGRMELTDLAGSPPDPINNGARVRVLTKAGRLIVDASIPPGERGADRVGWKVSGRGTSALYTDKSGAAGLNKLKLKWGKRSAPDRVDVTALAKTGTFGVDESELPLAVEVSLEPNRLATSRCGQLPFGTGQGRPPCVVKGGGSKVNCK